MISVLRLLVVIAVCVSPAFGQGVPRIDETAWEACLADSLTVLHTGCLGTPADSVLARPQDYPPEVANGVLDQVESLALSSDSKRIRAFAIAKLDSLGREPLRWLGIVDRLARLYAKTTHGDVRMRTVGWAHYQADKDAAATFLLSVARDTTTAFATDVLIRQTALVNLSVMGKEGRLALERFFEEGGGRTPQGIAYLRYADSRISQPHRKYVFVGRVRDRASGRPLDSAVVGILDSRRHLASRTDGDGQYVVAAFRSQLLGVDVHIRAALTGYLGQTRRVQVVRDTIQTDFELDAPPSSYECSAGPPREAVAYSSDLSEALVGRFYLISVRTSFETGPGYPLELELRATTAEEKAEARREGIGYRPRGLTHVGEFASSSYHKLFTAEADGAVIYLGCRHCIDASPTVLYVAAVTDDGFWGLYRNYQTGIGRVVDSEGNWAPDPAGYFCAERIPTNHAGIEPH
jgi:hypothetical protein